MNRNEQITALEAEWRGARWRGVARGYGAADVVRLRGSVRVDHTYARRGAIKLWALVNGAANKGYVNCLGALTAGQAVQQAKAGVEAVYLSGWQVAADNNTSETMYPDQSLYAYDSVPAMVRRINNAFARADQIQWARGGGSGGGCGDDGDGAGGNGDGAGGDGGGAGGNGVSAGGNGAGAGGDGAGGGDGNIDYFLPIVADGEAGFGGVLNAFELTKNMIAAGAAGVHFEDQLAAVKKCGHMGGKVLVPTAEAIQKLIAARLAADVSGTPTVILARTDAEAANLVTADFDERDRRFITGERTREGFFRVNNGLEQAVARGVEYAPYADMVWCETGTPDLGFAREFAQAVHQKHPGKLLAYNCSPSFNWKKNLDDAAIASFQDTLAAMGYVYQFITLAGIHSDWYGMYDLAHGYARGEGMRHYVDKVQQPEFAAAERGYTFVAHQQEVGAGYFDDVTTTIQGGASSVTALAGSTEEAQF